MQIPYNYSNCNHTHYKINCQSDTKSDPPYHAFAQHDLRSILRTGPKVNFENMILSQRIEETTKWRRNVASIWWHDHWYDHQSLDSTVYGYVSIAWFISLKVLSEQVMSCSGMWIFCQQIRITRDIHTWILQVENVSMKISIISFWSR
jgi:hypothetical protein